IRGNTHGQTKVTQLLDCSARETRAPPPRLAQSPVETTALVLPGGCGAEGGAFARSPMTRSPTGHRGALALAPPLPLPSWPSGDRRAPSSRQPAAGPGVAHRSREPAGGGQQVEPHQLGAVLGEGRGEVRLAGLLLGVDDLDVGGGALAVAEVGD